MDVARIPLEDVTSAGGRKVDAGAVALLKTSLSAVGLMNPIRVRAMPRNDGPTIRTMYVLVSGRHRVQAARELAWPEIDAVIVDLDHQHAELCEIDENLARAELTDSQRAAAHVRRVELMKALGLVSTHGGARVQNDKLSSCSYARQTADQLGVDQRTVQRDLRRGKEIDAGVLADVSGSALDKGVVLDELASTPREEQRAKLTEIAERRSTVRPAADPLNDPEAHEKQLAALMSAWNRAAAPVRQTFLERIDTPVFDNTRAAA